MRPSVSDKENGAALVMIVIVTMVLLTIGITMLLVNSSDTNTINPDGDRPISGVLPSDHDPHSGQIYDPDFGWITNDPDKGKAYFDNNLNNVFDESDVYVDLNTNLSTNQRLIIPPSVGEINIENTDRTYTAAHGIYFGASIASHQGHSSFTLLSGDGVIKIANPSGTSGVITHFKINIKNNNGDIIVDEGVTLKATHSSKGDITLDAGNKVKIAGANLDAGSFISITAGTLIDLSNASVKTWGTKTFIAGNNPTPGTITVNKYAGAEQPGTRILNGAGQAGQATAKPLSVNINGSTDGQPQTGTIVKAAL